MPKAIRDMIDADLLCIGSGPAGQRAAVQAAKLGKRVVMVEKRRVVGGVCLDTGTIPSKTFREAVLAFGRQAEQFRKRHGFAVPARFDVDQLFARVNEVVEREGDVVQRQLERNDVTVVRGEASFIDQHIVQVFAEEALQWVQAEHIVIAVGTVPAPPLGMKDEHPQIITSDKVMSLKTPASIHGRRGRRGDRSGICFDVWLPRRRSDAGGYPSSALGIFGYRNCG